MEVKRGLGSVRVSTRQPQGSRCEARDEGYGNRFLRVLEKNSRRRRKAQVRLKAGRRVLVSLLLREETRNYADQKAISRPDTGAASSLPSVTGGGPNHGPISGRLPF